MSSDRARLTRAHHTPEATNGVRRVLSALLSVVMTFSLAAFIFGGTGAHQAQTEVGRHDAVSVDSGTASPWFRRGDPRVDKCAVGIDCELMTEDDFDLLEVEVQPADEPPPLESVNAFATQRRHAAPVRGPPC